MKKSNQTKEELLWRIGLVFLAGAAAVAFCVLGGWIDLKKWARPCLLYTLTGWYCPGCGGTRAVIAYFQGRWFTSFLYYPMIPYVLSLFIVFMVSHALRHLTKGKVNGLPYRDWYLYVAMGLFFLGWIGKNAVHACGGM